LKGFKKIQYKGFSANNTKHAFAKSPSIGLLCYRDHIQELSPFAGKDFLGDMIKRHMNQHRGILRIGTSGIAIAGNKLSFPPGYRLKTRLNYYGSLFDTLEVNSSFYKVPMPSTFEKWSNEVPENFQFTVKLWKEVTHVKELNSDLSNIGLFLDAADRIGTKKGCLLIQFPGKITLAYYKKVEQILACIQKRDNENKWRKAIEFRSSTWYTGETYELLDEYASSMVLHDIPASKNFEVHERKSPFFYYRFHGPKGDYRGSYGEDYLREKSKTICDLLNAGKDVYTYFNNTIGAATQNALQFKTMANQPG
jgi:uncharacterized protein YecE (DUF72 family)